MADFGRSVGVDHILELLRVQRWQKEEGASIRGRRRHNHAICTLYRIHDNARNRTMVCIAHRVLVRMRDTRNVLIHIMAHGVAAGENTLPMTQHAPGCVPSLPV